MKTLITLSVLLLSGTSFAQELKIETRVREQKLRECVQNQYSVVHSALTKAQSKYSQMQKANASEYELSNWSSLLTLLGSIQRPFSSEDAFVADAADQHLSLKRNVRAYMILQASQQNQDFPLVLVSDCYMEELLYRSLGSAKN